jgi:predicted porin
MYRNISMKTLLGTTALLTTVALSSAALAGGEPMMNKSHTSAAAPKAAMSKGVGPSVTIGGIINAQAGISDNDSNFETGTFSRDFKFANDTEVHVNVAGESDTGLRYGATIELEADVTGDNRGEGLNADKTFIWIESDENGRVELGNNSGAAQAMHVTAANIARATGGIDGDDRFYINTSAANFLSRAELPSAYAGGATEDATKISYYTPSFSGFSGGVTYTPDNGDSGSAAGFTGENNGDFENVFGLGLSYSAAVSDDLTLDTAITAEFGESELAANEDLAAWNIGAVLAHAETGVSIAASYLDSDDSGLTVGSNGETDAWTIGAAYEQGPWGVSVTYLESDSSDNDFNNLVFGADYELAPGLTPYVEVSFFDADAAGSVSANDNDGSVILVGTYLNF